jgi:hypothetical protein
VQVVVFLLVLLAGFVYIWRKGVLDWGVKGSRDRSVTYRVTDGSRTAA